MNRLPSLALSNSRVVEVRQNPVPMLSPLEAQETGIVSRWTSDPFDRDEKTSFCLPEISENTSGVLNVTTVCLNFFFEL